MNQNIFSEKSALRSCNIVTDEMGINRRLVEDDRAECSGGRPVLREGAGTVSQQNQAEKMNQTQFSKKRALRASKHVVVDQAAVYRSKKALVKEQMARFEEQRREVLARKSQPQGGTMRDVMSDQEEMERIAREIADPFATFAQEDVPKKLYDPELSLEDLQRIAPPTYAEMIQAGFPNYIANRLIKANLADVKLQKRGSFVEKVHEVKARGIQGRQSERYAPGLPAKVWRVPNAPAAETEKPSSYDPIGAKQWLRWEAKKVRATLTKKYEYVAGNDAARVLYYGSAMPSRPMFDELLAKAQLYRGSYNETSHPGLQPIPLYDYLSAEQRGFVDADYLMAGSLILRTPQDLEAIEPAFKRNKPIYKAAMKFLQGDRSEYASVARSLLKVFPSFTPQGCCSRRRSMRQRLDALEGEDDLESVEEPWVCFTHEVTVPVLEDIRALLHQLLPRGTGSKLLTFTSFLVALLTSTSWANVAAISTLYLSAEPFVARCVGAALRKACSKAVTLFQAEGDTSIFSSIKECLSDLWESIVGSAIATFFAETSETIKSSVKPMIMDLVFESRRAITRESATAIAKQLLGWVLDILNRLKMCITTASLDPLWGRKWDPTLWIRESEGLERFYHILTLQVRVNPLAPGEIQRLRDIGVLGPEWITPVTPQEWLNRVSSHLEQGRAMESYFKAAPAVVAELHRVGAALRKFHDSVVGTVNGLNSRAAPWAVMFYGQPGTGKTNIARTMIDAIGRANKLTKGADAVYDFQVGVNFQDRLQQFHWAIIMDDVDHSPAQAQSGVRTHVDHFNALVNNNPYEVEKADIESKGQVRAAPMIVVYCTNFPDGKAPTVSREPHAFYRRFDLFVRVEVKKEYQNASGALSPELAQQVRTHDLFDLYVSKYQRSTQDSKQFRTVDERMSFPQFMVLAQKQFRQKLDLQNTYIRTRTMGSAHCNVCFLPADVACGHELPEHEEFTERDTVTLQGSDGNILYKVWSSSPENRVIILQHFYPFDIRDAEGLVRSYKDMLTRLEIEMCPIDLDIQGGAPPDLVRWLTAHEQKVFETETIRGFLQRWCLDGLKGARTLVGHVVPFLGAAGQRYEVELEQLRRSMLQGLMAGVAFATYIGVVVAVCKVVARYQGDLTTKIDSGPLKDWARVEQPVQRGLPGGFGTVTWTKAELITCVNENTLAIEGPKYGMFGLALGHNTMVVPTHICLLGEVLKVTCQVGFTVEIVRTNENWMVCPSNPEISLVKIANLPGPSGVYKKIPLTIDESVSQFDEVQICRPGGPYFPSTNNILTKGCVRILMTNSLTKAGDCGSAYIARKGDGWKLVGIHYALHEVVGVFGTRSSSVAALLSGTELMRMALEMQVRLQGVEVARTTVAKVPRNIVLGSMGPKSEIWAAQSHHGVKCMTFGSLTPPLSGSTMKTKLRWSIMYESLQERNFEIEMCGVKDYWRFPCFRGDFSEVWNSPWTAMFATQNLRTPEDKYFRLALCDYLSGVEHLSTAGYRELDYYEAIKGIPRTYVNAVNMTTSVGPPYTGNKRQQVDVDEDELLLSPELMKMVEEIEEILGSSIPSPLGLCSLKDEAVKLGKSPRVFICLSFAFNLVMKRRSASWKSFMRANPEFFESMVGINMTSSECNKVVSILKSVSPELDRIYDGDVRAMDKSWNGMMFDYTAQFVYAISFALGVEPVINEKLILSLKHVTYSVKNDLFRTTHNPSGCDVTVEINGINISLNERYVYYRTHPFQGSWKQIDDWYATFYQNPIPPHIEGLDFRKNVALVHYGDDNLKAFRKPPGPDYEDIWAKELGMVMLPADKSDSKMRAKHISEVSFLKRDFVWNDELQFYLPPLSTKSLARMLLVRKDSVLSAKDHAATVLTEFLKEAVYHGREFYEKHLLMARELVEEFELGGNNYLDLRTYQEWFDQIKDDTFQTWSTRPFAVPSEVNTGTFAYQGMNNISLVNGADSAPEPQDAAVTSLTHNTGSIMGTAPMVISTVVETPRYFQTYPKNELSDFFARAVQIGSFTLSDSDLMFSSIFYFEPWGAYLDNAAVQAKTSSYTYIRGTLQLIFVVTAPGGSYGRYVITALPEGEVSSTLAEDLFIENCMQTDHYAQLDMSESNSAVFQLPWIADIDMTTMNAARKQWSIDVHSLLPINSGLAGGITKAEVKIYANLLDDYELAVPHFQGKKKIIANSALKQHAPAIHDAIGEGKGSAFAGKVASVLEGASSLPVIGAYAQTAAAIAHGAEGVLSWFGFTRETAETVPIPITMRSVTNVAHFDGSDSGDTAALSYVNEISYDPNLAGFSSEDCLATADFFSRWTLVKEFTWGMGAESGASLAQIPVTPSYCRDTNPTVGALLNLTTAGYFGLPFNYWRGDMEYKIIIPVSKFHRGVLQVIWVPNDSTVPAYDVTNISLNQIIDVSAGGDYNLKVGFARDVPYLDNIVITDYSPILNIGATNGTLRFRVVNPLSAPAELASTAVFVFARACPNMQFAFPRDSFVYRNGQTNVATDFELMTMLSLQGGALGDEVSTDHDVILVPESGPYPGDKILFGEQVNSIRALLQKPSNLGVYAAVDGTNLTIPMMFTTPGGGPFSTISPSWTWAGYYRACFLGLAASERYKIFPKDPIWLGANRVKINSVGGRQSTALSTLAPMTFCGPNKGAEFNIPYYYNKKYIQGRGASTLIPVATNLVFRGASSPVVIYHSLGPDIRATCFRQLPRVFLNPTPRVVAKWFPA